MKKLIKSKVYLVSSIVLITIFSLQSTAQKYNYNSAAFLPDSTLKKDNQYNQKMNEQSKRLENINQQTDSINKKWDDIEKRIKEQQRPK